MAGWGPRAAPASPPSPALETAVLVFSTTLETAVLVFSIRCAVLLTTHFLDEADALGDRIAILHKGRLQALGTSQATRSIVENSLSAIAITSKFRCRLHCRCRSHSDTARFPSRRRFVNWLSGAALPVGACCAHLRCSRPVHVVNTIRLTRAVCRQELKQRAGTAYHLTLGRSPEGASAG